MLGFVLYGLYRLRKTRFVSGHDFKSGHKRPTKIWALSSEGLVSYQKGAATAVNCASVISDP